jgi:hypothetical protein
MVGILRDVAASTASSPAIMPTDNARPAIG